MIKMIEGCDRAANSALIDQMYACPPSVFDDRLGWDVEVKNGGEIDRFDAEDPLYLFISR